MSKRITLLAITVSIMLSNICGCITEEERSDSNTIIVDINGGGDYTSIQEAIDNCKENSTIKVLDGTYFENIVINKTVVLIGNNPETTVINGNDSDDAVRIEADNVCISGFTICNSSSTALHSDYNAGIQITSDSNLIENCILSDNVAGIYIEIQGYNDLTNNVFQNNSYGIFSSKANYNNFSNNTFKSNTIFGIYLYSESQYNKLNDNYFYENSCALRIKSRNNFVFRNIFQNNGKGLYLCCGAADNYVYHNTFLNNVDYHGNDNFGGNHWNKDLPVGGNYWDDYTGVDGNNDGFGDTPYLVKERNQSGQIEKIEDDYPLMIPIVLP